jgi:hypothetical protein
MAGKAKKKLTKAEQDALNLWEHFTLFTKWGIILTSVLLVLMAIFLL